MAVPDRRCDGAPIAEGMQRPDIRLPGQDAMPPVWYDGFVMVPSPVIPEARVEGRLDDRDLIVGELVCFVRLPGRPEIRIGRCTVQRVVPAPACDTVNERISFQSVTIVGRGRAMYGAPMSRLWRGSSKYATE